MKISLMKSRAYDNLSCNTVWDQPTVYDGRGLRALGDYDDVMIDVTNATPNAIVRVMNFNTTDGRVQFRNWPTDSSGRFYIAHDHTQISASEYTPGNYVTIIEDVMTGRTANCLSFIISPPPPTPPPVTTGGTTSQIRTVNGQPKLFINNQEYNKAITEIYYYPEKRAAGVVPAYSTEAWVTNIKKVIDQAKNVGTGIVMARIWWRDLDKATARTATPENYYDFSSFDKVMDYAKEKEVYIIPSLMLHYFAPEWWLKENHFPPNYNTVTCDFCETDSYGNVYQNPSIGSDVTKRDFGIFVKAVVNRYKNHPALVGWASGIGPTGEDGYGPNYTMLQDSVGSTGTVVKKPLQFTDYSPFYQRSFRVWLKDKYKTDSALRTAWNDATVSLSTVSVPPAKDLVKNPDTWGFEEFPQEAVTLRVSYNFDALLTKKGLDFYNFRTYMANKDRDYYANLFKTNDPNHVVFFNASGSKVAMANSNIDGYIHNPSLCFNCSLDPYRQDQFWEMPNKSKTVAGYGKLIVIAAEDYSNGPESNTQLAYITAVQKAVKCAGGIPGYASDLANGIPLYPSWNSVQAQNAVKEINNYSPGWNCSCDLVNDLYRQLSCDSSASRDRCTFLIDKAGKEFCGSRYLGGNQTAGRCGDGVCDEIERSAGVCPQDCR
jgi:hypothetical protein